MFENSWLEDEIFYFISQKYVQSFDRICSFIMYFLVVGFHSDGRWSWSNTIWPFHLKTTASESFRWYLWCTHMLICDFSLRGVIFVALFSFFGSKDNKASASAAHNFEIKNLWKCLI